MDADVHDLMPGIVEPGTTVLTVNNRLARALAAAHARAMQAAGHNVWETPAVLPFSAFVARQWERAREAQEPGRDSVQGDDIHETRGLPRLLGNAQCQVLWQRAVRENDASSLLSVSAAATSAAAARELLLRHAATLSAAQCHDDVDAQAFRRWHAAFELILASGHWIDLAAATSELVQWVLRCSSDGFPDPERPVCLRVSGFEQLTAQQQSLLEAYSQAGVRIDYEAPPRSKSNVQRASFASPQDELQAMACWARALLDDGEAGPIGIVLTDLDERLDLVEACFEDRLHPSSQVAMRPQLAQRVFNISLGRALSQLPVIGSALAALQLLLPVVDAKTVGLLATSEYLDGASSELAQRLALDVRLRESGVRSVRVRHLARVARSERALSLSQRIVDVIALAPHARSRHSLIEHAQRFTDALRVLGWPTGRTLGSVEFQAVESLREQLETLAEMASVIEPCTTSAALALLQRLAGDAVFQARTASAPVQIMGVLEAAGMTFSKLWVGALDDRQWPPTDSPNALLPMSFQRQHEMPGASPERSLIRARNIMTRLLSSAGQVIVSSARADGDTPLRASPGLSLGDEIKSHDVDADSISMSNASLPDEAIADAAPKLEHLSDWRAQALAPNWRARGGSRVLTDQAACPFRAFARHRLVAKGVVRSSTPLDPSTRGSLAHRLMQEVFIGITGLNRLREMGDSEREEVCSQAAETAVTAMLRRLPGEVPSALIDTERARMKAMAQRWLAVELTRAPFTVEAVEQRRTVRIGGLSLTIQLDRVDQVAGRRLLIDYKSGNTSRAGWFGERPDEPQLPLYALSLDSDGHRAGSVAALCFARLRRAQEGFDGIGEDETWVPGLKALGAQAKGAGAHRDFADMTELKAHWAQVLTALAEEFASGQARVDPKPLACQYCDVRALCRVDALGRVVLEEACE
ncbi:MAG: ATP-dependent helicase/nuclease subunit B [Gammaproteobacteria bacterium]